MADHAKIVEANHVILGGVTVLTGGGPVSKNDPQRTVQVDDIDDFGWVVNLESRFLHDPSGWSA